MFGDINTIIQAPLFNLLFLVAVAWSVAIFLERFHVPIIIGELLAGIMIGPAVLKIIHPTPEIDLLSNLGMFFLIFYAGLETDPKHLRKTTHVSVTVGLFGILLPFTLGTLTTFFFGANLLQALLVGSAISATSMVTKTRILSDLEMDKTDLAYNMMGAAIVDNISIFLVLTIIIKTAQTGFFTFSDAVATAVNVILFFGATLAMGYLLFPKLSKYFTTQRGKGFTFALLMGFLFAFLAEAIRLPFILGAYFAGLFVREEIMSHSLFRKMRDRFLAISHGFLGPIFIMSIAFKVDLAVMVKDFWLVFLLFMIAFLGKLMGVYFGAILSGISSKEALMMGFGMNGRGEIELILAVIGLQLKIINQEILSVLVMVAFASTFVAPFMIQRLQNNHRQKLASELI